MDISKKSWHYWIYTHTYENGPSSDGCAYIRKTLLAGLWFIPLTVFFAPYLLIEFGCSLYEKEKFEYPVYVDKFINAFWTQLIIWIVMCMTFFMWFHVPPTLNKSVDWHPAFLIGFICWVIVVTLGVVVGVGYSIEWLIKQIKYKNIKEKKPSLLSIYIKSVKEKHCPKINIID